MQRARAGDDAAIGELIARLQPRVFRWALSYTGDADEAEDVVQEAFVAMHHALPAFRGDAPFTTWLYRITARAASQRRRTDRRRALLGRSIRPEREVYETDPGGRVDRERLTALVRALWSGLPQRQRVVFDLVDLQGHTPTEAASLLSMKAVTLRANLFKARQTVRAGILAQRAPGSKEET